VLEGPLLPVQPYNLGDIEGARETFYQVSTFPLLRVNQGSVSTGLCDASPTVWTSVGGDNYAQRNLRGRGLNSRPPSSIPCWTAPPSQFDHKTQVI
jgi:hypothetical protein